MVQELASNVLETTRTVDQSVECVIVNFLPAMAEQIHRSSTQRL